MTIKSTSTGEFSHYVVINYGDDSDPYLTERHSTHGTPMDEWHGTAGAWKIGALVTEHAWNTFIEQVRPVLAEVRKAYAEDFDHNANLKPRWNVDKYDNPVEAIDKLIEKTEWHYDENGVEWHLWDEGEWLWDAAKHEIQPEWTDDQVGEWLKACRETAESEGIVLYGDFEEDAIEIRDEKREAASA